MNYENENRMYKDSVFVDYFADDEIEGKKNFLDLYNALHGTKLKLENTKIERFKVEKVLYRNLYNDISMLVNDRLIVLMEHQSTLNPNMPLRCLEYVTRLYEKIIPLDSRYSSKLLQIPTPEFFVFYNGNKNIPDESELKLSEAFMHPLETFCLDLKVKIFNIKYKETSNILKKCLQLNNYSKFIDIVEKERKSDLDGFLERSIEIAQKQNLFPKYLDRKGYEVRNMLIANYSWEDDLRVHMQEAREDAALETATNLLKLNLLTIEQIATSVDLPIEEVKKLAAEIKEKKD